MAWSTALLLALVGFTSADYGWKPGRLYRYTLNSTTMTGHHQVADQYSGVAVTGKLHIYVESDNKATAQIVEPWYADFNEHLSGGWSTDFSPAQLNFKRFPIKNDVFYLYFRKGLVEKLVVENETQNWELNFIKAIASQFQVDVQGQNAKRSHFNDLPNSEQHSGVYKTMEDSVNGVYETIYEVLPIPQYLVQSVAQLPPQTYSIAEGDFYHVLKSRNFSSSDKHIVYHYGMNGHEGWHAGTNEMGNFFSRTSQSRIVLSGSLNKYTIHSTVTTEKVIVAPQVYNTQKAIVVSSVNLTLESVDNKKDSEYPIENPRNVDSLSYEYEQVAPQNGDSGEGAKSSSSSSSESSSSQSSSSSSEENNQNRLLNTYNRQTRSAEWDSSDQNMKKSIQGQGGQYSSSSSSSSEDSSISSSEEYLSPQPELYEAPKIEFLPDYMVNQHESGQIAEQIERLSRKAAQSLQNPSNILEDQALTTLTMLTHLTATASSQQLDEVTEKLFYPEEKVQGSGNQESYHNYKAWQAYRDAVAQAGTGPALVQISKWLKAGQVGGNEGAQILAILPKAARYPTAQYLDYFFDLVKSPHVQNQRYVNHSAIFAFTDLYRRSSVDKYTAHHRYPIHLHAAQSPNYRSETAKKYITYFKEQLQKAVKKGDSIQTSVYIRAISSTAHPDILGVFEPYLEGKENISHFQRLTIIAYLSELIDVYPKIARNVLYRIYQNQGDVPEVRAAAVMQLIKTNPPAQMLQHIAEQTNYDYSEHVNAAVKSAIESAANADINSHPELVKNARSAANHLTSKNYGFQYSQNYIRPYNAKEHHTLQYDHYFSYIKGFDGMLPNSVLYYLQRKINGYIHEPETASFMSSSSEEFLNFLLEILAVGNHQKVQYKTDYQKKGKKSQYTYDTINEALNQEYEQPSQIEGNFFFQLFGAPRFFAFDNHTIEQFPQYLSQFKEKLENGFNFHETKYYNQYSVEMGFPLASGVPFTYSYNEPALVYANVQAKGQVQTEPEAYGYQFPFSGSTEGTYQFTWSSQKRGKLGFVAPYSDQKYIAVVEKKTQFYFPFEGRFVFNGSQNFYQAKIKPYSGSSNEQQKIFQHSTSVYTTHHNLYDVKPYLKGPNAKYVRVGPKKSYKSSFGGEYTGHVFQLEAESENYFADVNKFYRAFKSQNYDYISSLVYHDLTHTVANNYYAISYNPKNSPSEEAVFSVYYNKEQHAAESKKSAKLRHNPKGRRMRSGVGGNMAQPSSTDSRKEELFANVYSDIPDAHAYIFDASAFFGGKQNRGQYVFTAAYSESPVSEKSRFLAYYSASPYQESQSVRPFNAAMQFNFKQPQVPIFNYREASKADPTSYVHGQINFDDNENSKIVLEGVFRRTEERKNYASQLPDSVMCRQQMQQNNFFQPACRNATLHANALDNYKFTVTYHNVPQVFQNAAYALYGAARYNGYQYNEENFAGAESKEGQIKFVAQLSEDLDYFNVSLNTPYFDSHFQNVQLHHYLRSFVVQYPAYNQLYMYSPYYFDTKPYGTCAVDTNVVSTFNNRSYPINIEDEYYVLAIAAQPSYPESSEESYETYYDYQTNYAVLAKGYKSQNKEVQVVLGNEAVTLKPSGPEGVSVSVNGEIFQTYPNKMARWQGEQYHFVAYSLPGPSNVVLYFFNHSLQVYYDGYRVAISVPNDQRNKVRGLCGTFDGEPANDFTTPQNCVVRDPHHFAASYAVPSSSKQKSAKYQNAPCYPKEVVYADVVSDVEAGRAPRRTTLSGNEIGEQNRGKQSCSLYKVQIVKDGGRSCFSLKPQVTCSSSCRASRKIEKQIDFHCAPDTDNLTGHWLRMVKQGANPDFSQKTANSRMRVMLPEACISS